MKNKLAKASVKVMDANLEQILGPISFSTSNLTLMKKKASESAFKPMDWDDMPGGIKLSQVRPWAFSRIDYSVIKLDIKAPNGDEYRVYTSPNMTGPLSETKLAEAKRKLSMHPMTMASLIRGTYKMDIIIKP